MRVTTLPDMSRVVFLSIAAITACPCIVVISRSVESVFKYAHFDHFNSSLKVVVLSSGIPRTPGESK